MMDEKSPCNGINHELPPRQIQTTNTANTLLEPNHPRPGTFTMEKDYVPQTEPVFPPGYLPSQSSFTNEDVSFPLTYFGEFPVSTKCTNCKDAVITSVTYRPGNVACLLASIMLIVGCCFVPFCVRRFQDVNHWCPRCHEHLGTFRRKFKG